MLKNGRFHTASPTPKKAQIGTRYWFIALFPVVCYLTGGASFPYLGFIMQIHTPKKHFGAQCKGKHGELWYHLFGSTQNGYLSNHKVVCRCDFHPHV